MKIHLTATALALTATAALIAFPAALHAGDEAPRDTIERLMPQLMSDDDATRADAERKLFELGEAGRDEMERITRETDPRRAVTALRLLQSRQWDRSNGRGEQRVRRERNDSEDEDRPSGRAGNWRAEMERRLDEMRKRFENFDRDLFSGVPGFELQGRTLHGATSGSVVENDKVLSWNVEEDGRIKVTTKDGKDAPEQTIEAESLDAFRRENPELAKRVEPLIGAGRPRSFVLRMDPNSHTFSFGGSGSERERVADPLQLEAPEPPVLGVAWTPVPDVLRDQIELPPGGIVVETVVRGSLAEKLGIVRHDVLVELQGKAVSGSSDVRSTLEAVKDGEKVTAVVVRKGLKRALDAIR